MKVTDVRIKKVENAGKLKAVASIVLDDEIAVHDIKIIEDTRGIFFAMPSVRLSNGEFVDIAHPINSETRLKIQQVLFDEYNNM